jgi:hypothetical protein
VFDRFTLDEISAKIWWPLAMVALVALVLTVPAANHAADRARRESAAEAIVLSSQQIEPLTTNGLNSHQLHSALAQIQAANPSYEAVRLWSDQRILIASSLSKDPLQGGTAFNDADINGALSSGSRLAVTDRLPTGDPGPTTVHSYTRIDGPLGFEVTEFEASDAALLAEVHHDWNGYRIVAAAAFLLLLGLALLSMREPVADIGVGVPFYPASLPPNLAIVDAERAIVIEHEDDHVRLRVESLQQRLDESERMRLKAEARLQQALTTLGTGGRNVPGLPPEPPTPTLPATRASGGRAKPTPAEPVADRPAAAAPVAPAANPLAAAAAAAEAPATAAEAPAAAAEAPAAADASPKHASKKRTSRRRPAAERTAARRSRAEEPAEAPATPVPTSERVAVVAGDVTVTAKAPAQTNVAPSKDTRPEVVVLPSEQPSAVGAKPAAKPVAKTAPKPAAKPEPKAAEPDTDVVRRLVPDGDAHPEPLDDPADLRAKLARTAALKKPGSRERQEQREALQDHSSEQ